VWTTRIAVAVYRRTPPALRRVLIRLLSPSYCVGALVIVRRPDGRILLVRQSYRPDWFLPGGLIKRGEEPHAAARRELAEEAGVELAAVDGTLATFVDTEIRAVTVFCGATVDDRSAGDARPRSREILEVGWFAPDALPPINEELERGLRGTGLLGR
jgi:8-oxo-dGTP pyrophosphatase MutT (NUDIX family)